MKLHKDGDVVFTERIVNPSALKLIGPGWFHFTGHYCLFETDDGRVFNVQDLRPGSESAIKRWRKHGVMSEDETVYTYRRQKWTARPAR